MGAPAQVDIDEVIGLYLGGMGVTDIARKVLVTREAVYATLKRYGIPLRYDVPGPRAGAALGPPEPYEEESDETWERRLAALKRREEREAQKAGERAEAQRVREAKKKDREKRLDAAVRDFRTSKEPMIWVAGKHGVSREALYRALGARGISARRRHTGEVVEVAVAEAMRGESHASKDV